MALIVMTEATVHYACRLSAEDEQKGATLEEAVEALYDDSAIKLYADSWESDFNTNTILDVGEE